jgi:type II secretory pathway predicted ATPase ExeA
MLSGEVGTGKTLLIRCLLDALSQHRIPFAFVFNPRISVSDFLWYVVRDLGLEKVPNNKAELLLELNNFLIRQYRAGSTTVLIIDESQHLDHEVLEEVRLLTNLETTQQKLLQIILTGQPELEERLDAPELRQLKQRVALRCRLRALSERDTYSYVARRLLIAGCDRTALEIFPQQTLAAVHRYAKGIPRLINLICEQALINAYARQMRVVSSAVIEEIAMDFRLEASPANGTSAIFGARETVANNVSYALHATEKP